MKRVLVIGSGGAGKSTFAKRLGELLNIPVKHLDMLYWQPGWRKPSKEDWLKTITEVAKEDSWVMDGNYSGTLDVRIQHCDTIVFLDMPRLLCLGRITKRRLLYRNAPRPDMAEGCPEQLDWEFVQWVWNYSRRSRPKVVRLLRENAGNKHIVWLRSRAEVEKLLEQLKNNGR